MSKWIGLVLFGLVAACGGDASECEDLGDRVCAAACSCSDDCRLQYASGSTQGFGNEITAASTQCRTAIAGSCEMGDLDIEACNAVADEAACVTAGSNIALEVSQACFGN